MQLMGIVETVLTRNSPLNEQKHMFILQMRLTAIISLVFASGNTPLKGHEYMFMLQMRLTAIIPLVFVSGNTPLKGHEINFTFSAGRI